MFFNQEYRHKNKITKNTKDLDENIEKMVLEGYSLVNQINLFYFQDYNFHVPYY